MQLRNLPGIALLIALWLLTVLIILIAGLAALVQSHSAVARNFGDEVRARWAANAGVQRAMVTLQTLTAEPATAWSDGTDQLQLTSDDTDVLSDSHYSVIVTDEASKVNLNTATVEQLQLFFPAEVADAIIDWRDTDSTPQPQGAEDDYYMGLPNPYHCKNAPFSTVGELMLVSGVTAELLQTPVTTGGPPLQELLTVSSQDSNTTADGQSRLLLTNATQQTLTTPGLFTAQEATAVMQARRARAFTSPADLLRVQSLTRARVAELYDRFTCSRETVRPGLININTAPAIVLAMLPGMDISQADAIVQYRQEQGAFADVGQLLLLETITNETFTQISDLLTTRSQTFQIVSTGETTTGIPCTVTTLLRFTPGTTTTDTTTTGTTTTSPMILYWQEK